MSAHLLATTQKRINMIAMQLPSGFVAHIHTHTATNQPLYPATQSASVRCRPCWLVDWLHGCLLPDVFPVSLERIHNVPSARNSIDVPLLCGSIGFCLCLPLRLRLSSKFICPPSIAIYSNNLHLQAGEFRKFCTLWNWHLMFDIWRGEYNVQREEECHTHTSALFAFQPRFTSICTMHCASLPISQFRCKLCTSEVCFKLQCLTVKVFIYYSSAFCGKLLLLAVVLHWFKACARTVGWLHLASLMMRHAHFL